MLKSQGLCHVGVPLFLANFPNGLLNDDFRLPRRPLMVRAALLRRSCDGVVAATEMRRPAPSRSFCASRLDALNEEPASFPPGLIQISMVVAHSPRPPPWPCNSVGHYPNTALFNPPPQEFSHSRRMRRRWRLRFGESPLEEWTPRHAQLQDPKPIRFAAKAPAQSGDAVQIARSAHWRFLVLEALESFR